MQFRNHFSLHHPFTDCSLPWLVHKLDCGFTHEPAQRWALACCSHSCPDHCVKSLQRCRDATWEKNVSLQTFCVDRGHVYQLSWHFILPVKLSWQVCVIFCAAKSNPDHTCLCHIPLEGSAVLGTTSFYFRLSYIERKVCLYTKLK